MPEIREMTNEEMEIEALKKMGRELSKLTRGCRISMHEPDESGVYARVINPEGKLDNAGIAGYEIIIEIERRDGEGWAKENMEIHLADLIALARYGEPERFVTHYHNERPLED